MCAWVPVILVFEHRWITDILCFKHVRILQGSLMQTANYHFSVSFFLIPATLLVFRFNHLCRELDHTTGMLYIESKICSYWSYCILLHLIASCLDDQILGASKALEGPNGFVFARHCHGTSWKHHPEAKPLGGKIWPSRIWDSSLRMRDGWVIFGTVNHWRWWWHTNMASKSGKQRLIFSFVGRFSVENPPGLGHTSLLVLN